MTENDVFAKSNNVQTKIWNRDALRSGQRGEARHLIHYFRLFFLEVLCLDLPTIR